MLRQIRLLAGIQLINLCGINEVRYTKDTGKRNRFLGLTLVWAMLLVMLAGYVAMLSYGFAMMGMAEFIPGYLYTVASLIMLFFSFFKAGSIIFQMKSYEMMVSLPVSGSAIVISRFLTMYVTNFLMGLLIMTPGAVVYGYYVHPGLTFYLISLLGVILLPLLPLTIATGLGAGIMALTAKMRYKSLASAFLTILVVLVAMAASMGISREGGTLDETMIETLMLEANRQFGQIYPPAMWFQNAAVYGKTGGVLLLLFVSVVLLLLLVIVLQKNFLAVCTALNATSAKNNYKMQRLSAGSVVKALWTKEGKRYFASSIYVSNTLMGYILMAVMAVALFVAGPEKVEEILQMPGIVVKVMPLLLGLMAAIMPTTSCSVSMEGKQWWQLQTLPVRSQDIWNAKVLFNLSIALPFYLIAVLFSVLALKPSLVELVWLTIIPAIYVLFTAVVGITVNLAMPIFDWENETRVVKQSASTLVIMLVGFVSVLPFFVAVMVLPGDANIVYLVASVVLLVLTGALHGRNAKKKVIL